MPKSHIQLQKFTLVKIQCFHKIHLQQVFTEHVTLIFGIEWEMDVYVQSNADPNLLVNQEAQYTNTAAGVFICGIEIVLALKQ